MDPKEKHFRENNKKREKNLIEDLQAWKFLITLNNNDSDLKKGDIITEVNRDIIVDTLGFIDLVNSIEKTGRNSLLLKILREGKSLWVNFTNCMSYSSYDDIC